LLVLVLVLTPKVKRRHEVRQKDMRLAFAGTPAFAATALTRLLQAGHDIALVLTQPDRPAGRGQQLQASAVKQTALAAGLAVAQPQGLKLGGRFAVDAAAAQAALQAAQVDAMVVVAYGLILPAWVLAAPKHGCFNIHGSLLPRWRGAAPIQRAIEAGDAQTGITIIQMDAGLDTGDMLALQAVAIDAVDTAQTLLDKLAPMGATLMVQVLAQLAQGQLSPQPQPADLACYANKIDKAEAAIDWQQPAAAIERRLRAFDPFPGATFEHQGQRVKLWRAHELGGGLAGALNDAQTDASDASQVVAVGASVRLATPDGPRWAVRCGQGLLVLDSVQWPGERRIDAAQALKRSGL
jgi:methionyl-tRNA formyltransferase